MSSVAQQQPRCALLRHRRDRCRTRRSLAGAHPPGPITSRSTARWPRSPLPPRSSGAAGGGRAEQPARCVLHVGWWVEIAAMSGRPAWCRMDTRCTLFAMWETSLVWIKNPPVTDSQWRKLEWQVLQFKSAARTEATEESAIPSDAVLEHHPANPTESVTMVILGSCAHQDQLGRQPYKEVCNDLTAIEVSKRNSLFARPGRESSIAQSSQLSLVSFRLG